MGPELLELLCAELHLGAMCLSAAVLLESRGSAAEVSGGPQSCHLQKHPWLLLLLLLALGMRLSCGAPDSPEKGACAVLLAPGWLGCLAEASQASWHQRVLTGERRRPVNLQSLPALVVLAGCQNVPHLPLLAACLHPLHVPRSCQPEQLVLIAF